MSLTFGSHIYLKTLSKKMVFPIALAVDVTQKCNLRCRHCYFQQQENKKEISTIDWLEKLKKIKKNIPGIVSVDWIGGEPLLRKDLVEQGMKLFPLNVVITNGMISLPNWKNCFFLVSIDGTKIHHEENRGLNTYDRIKNNINRNDVNVFIVFTINKKNVVCIEDFLKEWRATKVQGVLFLFYTPVKGIKEDLWIPWKERDVVLKKIIKLKSKYKKFILNNLPDIEAMQSKNAKEVLKNCLFKRRFSVALSSDGQVKNYCNMGEKADCSRCGCIVPYYLPYLKKSQIKISPQYKKVF